MAWSTPRTWVAGETLTAALLNAELRDNLNASEPVGSLHYYVRAATTVETLINAFALECNAVAVSRTTYSALSTLLSGLSYPFGVGNGSTTMNLPDAQGRALVAMASGGHANVNGVGDSDGLPKANRTPKEALAASVDGGSVSGGVTGGTVSGTTGSGGGGSHTHSFSATTSDGSNSTFNAQGNDTSVSRAAHTHSVSGTTGSSGDAAHTHSFSGSLSGGSFSGSIVGASVTGSLEGSYLVAGVWAVKV